MIFKGREGFRRRKKGERAARHGMLAGRESV